MENPRWPVEGAVQRTRLQRVPAPESQPLQGYLGEDSSQGISFCSWHSCIHSTNMGAETPPPPPYTR